MASERSEILAGALVLCVAFGFAAYALRMSAPMLGQSSASYPVYASFRSADGISVGSDVRLAGVKIGTVSGLELDPQSYYARATLTLRKEIELPTDSVFAIGSEGLLGGSFVDIQPGGMFEVMSPGDEAEYTQGAVSLINLLAAFAAGSAGEGAPSR